MTDTDQPIDLAAAWARIEAQQAARASLAEETHPHNKAEIFAPLAAAGIQLVTVTFDGEGDSGQIEDIAAFADDVLIDLPAVDVKIVRPLGDGSGVTSSTLPLKEAVIEIAYDLLEEEHGGWENNDGAYGEFAFDVAARSIRLDFNERYTTTELSQHEF